METTTASASTWNRYEHVSKQGEWFKKHQARLKCLKEKKILFGWAEARGRQISNLEGQGICSGSHTNICPEATGENEEKYAL